MYLRIFSAKLIHEMADHLVSDGYLKMGYKYVIIDDGWSQVERGPNGELVADPKRFPGGMKPLIDYVWNAYFHSNASLKH